ncbi:MAG: twin-arginine translocase subunit TatC [Haloplanus sp.]
MAEESESESPSETTTDDTPSDRDHRSADADTESEQSDAESSGAIDPETDTVYSPEDAPEAGGSIEDYLDDDSVIAGPRAPEGETGSSDPFDPEERRSVSEAVGAPVPDDELDEAPELEPNVATAATDDGSDEASDVDDADDGGDEETADDDVTAEDLAPPPGSAAPEATETDESVVETGAGAEPESPPQSDLDTAGGEDEGLLGEGPASDEEMPLAAHIEEMVRRLAVVLLVGGIVTVAVFPVADQLINFLWNSHIPGAETIQGRRPRLYGPLELLLTELKVAALAGFVVGLPIAVYETYLFMRPGLFPRERRYYLAAVPTSLVLALIGVVFAHFVVLPAIFAYFTAYTTGTAFVAFGLAETFSLILVLMGYMALVFQIPLFIMLAIMMNLTTRTWLEQRRLLFWGGFLGLAFLVSPDPTGMAPIIVAATMITLFEGTLALLRWTGN